ncbi:Hypp5304 [Branchiostoma lanceolatum]|uniref:Hypp5304 protein n=2 Tax=Branchiostoma lanceolatum TaxID=7740 RepID=A0A8K0AEE8_BRALA|nr:Hypp5304 [Branchiostoma lanceolatum]
MMMTTRLRYRCSGCGYTTLQRKRIGDHVDGHRRDLERRAGKQDGHAEKERVGSSADQVRILIQVEEKAHKPGKPQQVKRKRRCWTDDILHLFGQVNEVGQQQKTSPNNSECLPVKGSVQPQGNGTQVDGNSSGKGQKPQHITAFNQLSNNEECVGQGVVRNSPAKQSDELQKGVRSDTHSVLPGFQAPTEQIPGHVGRGGTCRDAAVSYASPSGDTTKVSDRDSAVTLPPLWGMVGADSQRPMKNTALPVASLCCAEKSSTPQNVVLTLSPHNGMDNGTSLTSKTTPILETTDREHCVRPEDSCTTRHCDNTPVIMDVFSLSEKQATINKSQPDILRGLSVTNPRRLSLSYLGLAGSEVSRTTPTQREIRSAPPALQTHGTRVDTPALTPTQVCNLPVSTASDNSLVNTQPIFLHQANIKTSSDLHGMQKCGEIMTESQNDEGYYRPRDLRTKDQGLLESMDGLVYSNQSATEASVPVNQGVDVLFTDYGNVTSSTANGTTTGATKFRSIAPKPPSVDMILPYYVGESRVFRCFQCPFMCLEKKLLLMHMREEQCYSGLVRRESAMEALKMLKEGHTAKDASQLQASNETCHGATPIIDPEKSVPSPAANIEISSGDDTPEEDTNTVPSVAPVLEDNNNVQTSGSVDSTAKESVERKIGPTDEDLIPSGTTFPKEVKFAAFKRPITIRNQHQADKLREIMQHEHLKARFMHMLKVRLKRALTGVNDKNPSKGGADSNGQKSQTVSANVQETNVTKGSRCNTHAKVSSSPTLSPIPEVNIKKEVAEKSGSHCNDEKQDDQKIRPATPSKNTRSGQTSTSERQTKRMSPPNVPSTIQTNQKGESIEEDDVIVYVGQDCEVQRGKRKPPGKLQTVVEALRENHASKIQGATTSDVGQPPQTASPLSPSPLLQLARLTNDNPYLVNKPPDNARVTGGPTTEVSVSPEQSVAMPCTSKNVGTASPDPRHATKRGAHMDADIIECTPPKRQALQQKHISFQDFQHLMRRHGKDGHVAMTTNMMYAPQTHGVDPGIPLHPSVGPVANTQNYRAGSAIAQNPSNTRQYPFQQQLGRIKDTVDQSMAYKYCNGTVDQSGLHPSRAWPLMPSRSPMNTTSPLDFHTDASRHAAYRLGPPPPLYSGTPRFSPPFRAHETGNRYKRINNQETQIKEDDISPEPMDLRVKRHRPSPPPLIRIEPAYYPRTTITSAAGPPIHNGWTRQEAERLAYSGQPNSHTNSRERLSVILDEIETTVCSSYAAQMRSLP